MTEQSVIETWDRLVLRAVMGESQRRTAAVPAGWARLRAAVNPHPVDAGTLGEYAQLYLEQGGESAARAFPDVAGHLAAGCSECLLALDELLFLLRDDQEA